MNRTAPVKVTRAKGEHTAALIIETAAEIIRHSGLHACTHRAVSEELSISPGTITWHFKTLDDLHCAVIERAIISFKEQTLAWFSACTTSKIPEALSQFLFWTLSQPDRLLREYELFVAAVSRPRLRAAAAVWQQTHSIILQELFCLRLQQADAIVAYTDAWLLRSVINEGAVHPDITQTELIFSTILLS